MPWYCQCQGRSLIVSLSRLQSSPAVTWIVSVYTAGAIGPEHQLSTSSSCCFSLALLIYNLLCPSWKLVSLHVGAAILCVANPISHQSCTVFKNRLEKSLQSQFPRVSKTNKPFLLHTFLFLYPFSWEKGGGCAWSKPMCCCQNSSAANRPVPLMQIPGKWLFVVKLSKVLFLTLLLNCYILKLKQNPCDATNGEKLLNFNRRRKWRIDVETQRR